MANSNLNTLRKNIKQWEIKYNPPLHPLSYFYYEDILDDDEIKAMADLYGDDYKFSNAISQSGNIFVAKCDSKFVQFAFPYRILKIYISERAKYD